MIAWTVAIIALVYEYRDGAEFGNHEILSALPLSLLIAYGSLAFALNKTEVWISSDSIEVRNGPVPAGSESQTVRLDEIEICYYRRSVVPLKAGSASVFAVGIRLRAGEWVDIISSFETREEAKAAAERIAVQIHETTGRAIPVIDAKGYAPPVDWKRRRGLLIWSGAFIVALIWILAVDAL